MYDISKFSKYLNKENEDLATADMGLVDNAPQEAINAYEQFKKVEQDRINSDEDWE